MMDNAEKAKAIEAERRRVKAEELTRFIKSLPIRSHSVSDDFWFSPQYLDRQEQILAWRDL